MNDKDKIVELINQIDLLKFQLDNTKSWLERAEYIIKRYVEETDDKHDLGAMYFVDKISSY